MNEFEPSSRTIFLDALGIEDSKERAAYIARACGENASLLRDVQELLGAQAAAGRFLPDAPARPGSALLVPPAAAPDPRLTEKVGDRIGRYKLLQKIGEGGCGVVYMAEQEESLRRKVALKVIKLGMDTRQVIARFEAERQALAMMEHPNIAKVLDAGATETGRPFFVMELVRGLKITEYCDRNELSTRERLELFIRVCRAVQHAHQKGIIHRDIKPSNILVTVDDGVAVPKVIDFGIAKATEGRLTDHTFFTAFQQFLGTPAYMSPEQAAMTSVDIDTRSDIYSLGVLLYELLTGTTPFDTKVLLAAGLDAFRRTIRETEPLRPSTRLTQDLDTALSRRQLQERIHLVRGDLDWIVMKCLEKDRSRRFETANALAMDVQRHLANEAVVARPPSRLYELQKVLRRHKLGFAAAAAIVAILAAGTVVSAWQAVWTERQRKQVQRNVIRQYVANGARLMNDGDLFSSLLWFTEALRLDAGDARSEEPHRIRIASVLRQCPRLLTVLSHGSMVYHAEFSPDGAKVVTASDDHTARVWDATTGLRLLLLPHDGQVYNARFSPDGLRIITSSRDKSARIWDAGTGALLWTLQHTDTVWQGCFSPVGHLVATACGDQAQLWDAATGQRLGKPLSHWYWLNKLLFSPDGRFLTCDTQSDQAFLWNVAKGKLEMRQPGEFAGFTPDGQRLLSFAGDSVHVWDTRAFKELPYSPLTLAKVYSASFSPDGRAIVASGLDFTAQVWDADSGRPLFSPSVKHTGPILMSGVGPDGRRFATAGQDTVAQVWSTASGEPIGPPLKQILHVKYIAFNKDGRRLLANSCDQAARIWDMATGDVSRPMRPTFENEHRLVSPDGRYVLIAGQSNSISITDIASGKTLAALPHADPVIYASFSRDGQSVITSCTENNVVSSMRSDIYLWDARSGRRIDAGGMSHPFRLLYAAFRPDNRRVLTCGFDFTARVWDAQTGRPLTPPLRHREQIRWGAFSPDGRAVVTASWDRTVRVWDAATGNPVTPPLQHKETVAGAFWSEDGKRLTTLTKDDHIQVWDLATGEPLTPARNVQPTSAAPQTAGDLPRDDRPVADLVLLAQMLAVGRVDSDGSVVPLQLRELTEAWQTLRTKYPEQFATTPPEILAWRRGQEQESRAEGNTNAAKFHRDLALAEQPAAGNAPSADAPPRIPLRDQKAGPKQIDLSSNYTLPLHRNDGADYPELKPGLHELGGILFDIRGTIELDGKTAAQHHAGLPERIAGIRVGQKCRRLHFIQSTAWGGTTNGDQVATYILHYADGQQQELPVSFGWDTDNGWTWTPDGIAQPLAAPGGAIPVWNGQNWLNLKDDCTLWLFRSTRENPRPDVEVVSIDFVSSMSPASPVLAALTVE